jgi:hypothetical protein
MIEEFFQKCNFDKETVVVSSTAVFKPNACVVYETSGEFDSLSFELFCNNRDIKEIGFLSISAFDYPNILRADQILKKTQYLYLTYSPLIENRNFLSLPSEGWSIRFDTGSEILFENYKYLETLIQPNGIWINKNQNEHAFDESLAYCIVNFLKDKDLKSILDLGCGNGSYVRYFNQNDLQSDGYDGNPFTPEITNGLCGIADLSKAFVLENQYDCVMSLEVGEHIPKFYEEIFIGNIIRNAKDLVILSWAVPGQGGHGHVNCLENSYIKALMKEYGFENRIYAENILRACSSLNWFKDTIMVFKRIH